MSNRRVALAGQGGITSFAGLPLPGPVGDALALNEGLKTAFDTQKNLGQRFAGGIQSSDSASKLVGAGRALMDAAEIPLAGKFSGFLGPIGDAFGVHEGMSSAFNPKNTAGERVASGLETAGAGYGLAAGITSLAGGVALPAALPIAVGTGVAAGSVRAAEEMKNPAVRVPDVKTFRKAMPAVSTKGFNRNDPIPPGKAVAILNGKPILVDKGSIAGNKKVGRPWWDAGQYFGR